MILCEYKKEHGLQIYDAGREQAVIEKNSAYIKDPDIRSYYVRFLQDEMAVSKRYQEHIISGVKIAYSGIEGAYANIAAKQIFPYGKLISYRDFKAAYEAVERGECDCCVLPIEKLEMTVRDVDGKQMQILVPDGETVPTYGIRGEDGITKVTLYGAGLYTVIAFG